MLDRDLAELYDVKTKVLNLAVKRNIKRALGVFPIEKIYIDPDCGLKTRKPQEAEEKLKVMVSAVKELKEELEIE